MTQWKILVSVAMGLAFAAGLLVGLGQQHPDEQPPKKTPVNDPHDHGPGGPEADVRDLNLSDAQKTQIRQIWSAVMQGGPAAGQKRREIEQEYRDRALALLTPEQRAQYDKLNEEYEAELAAIDTDRDAKFQKAIDQTKALLNDEQRTKYGQILTRHAPGHGPGGPRGDHGPGGPPHDGHGPPMLFAPGSDHGPDHDHGAPPSAP